MLPAVLLLSFLLGMGDDAALLDLPSGSSLAIQLNRSINSKNAHPGDIVEATLMAPVMYHGNVLIPRSAKIRGHVLTASRRTHGSISMLAIQFHEARWDGGTAMLQAFIVRQLVNRTSIAYQDAAPTCGPSVRLTARIAREPVREGSPPADPIPQQPCDASLPLRPRGTSNVTVLTDTPLKKMRLYWAPALGATVLTSDRKDVGLGSGTMLEIRHVVH